MSERGTQGMTDVVAFWNRSTVSALAPEELLFVSDFDGTLSEIVPDSARSMALPKSILALKRLVPRLGAVVVLSSRTRKDLERLVPVPGIELIGDSGMGDASASEIRALRLFNARAARLLAGTPGVWLEMKPSATAVHYRRAEASTEEVLRLIEPLASDLGLFTGLGRRVIEVRIRLAPKGRALEGLIERVHPRGVVCIGDDEGDGPMFEVVRALSEPRLAVGVASPETAAPLFADCDLVVSGPQTVSELLTAMADWASRTEPLPNDGVSINSV